MNNLKTLAVKVYGMTDEEAQSLLADDGSLKDDAIATLVRKDQDRIKRMKDEHKLALTEKYNEGYSEAKKKERSKFEEEIKAAYEVQSEAIGVDLVKEVVGKSQSQPDDIKKHPEYLALERKIASEYIPKKDYEKVTTEYNDFKQQATHKEIVGRVTADGQKIFRSLNPVLPKDPKRAINQEKDFLAKLAKYKYQLQEDGNHLVLDAEGKRLETENANPVSFEELVTGLTLEYFEIDEQTPRENGGVDPKPALHAGPKSKEEFYKAYDDEPDAKKRVEMYEAAEKKGWV